MKRSLSRPRISSRAFAPLSLTLLLAGAVLAACGDGAAQTHAHASQARLQAEISRAQAVLGLPARLVTPIATKAQATASGESAWGYDYTKAAASYDSLYGQLTALEANGDNALSQAVQQDIDALGALISERRGQGFDEANAYQAKLALDGTDLAAAKTPAALIALDQKVSGQLGALRALWPAWQKLQAFKDILRQIRAGGADTAQGDAMYQRDLTAFDGATNATAYDALAQLIDAQTLTLMATQVGAAPYVASAMVAGMQQKIDLLKQSGGAGVATFQAQHDDLAKRLAAGHSLSDFLTIGQQVNFAESSMGLPLARAQALKDLADLKALIAQGQAINIGGAGAAYEYADRERGYGDSETEVLRAKSLEDYQQADQDVSVLLLNLRALLKNLNDQTPHDQAHQADLDLMSQYGILDGKVIIVSLREQYARLYENGKVVMSFAITTGRPEKPTPPGLHYAMYKQTHLTFTSSDPKNSPLYYSPTAINYGILYANYGFFLHDAGWRRRFGPGSNLPHWDPAAFNGGSHGCINFKPSDMATLYAWTPVGSPVVVY
ncbi:MAG TPA: L,D-transpeptidase [Ktedonobacterales bacterium]